MNKHLTIFHKKHIKHGAVMEVITGAYELDFATGQVRVAGVKFTRKSDKSTQDNWNRKVQSNYARIRLAETPFILQFGAGIKSLHHYNYRRLEKFMRSFFTLNGLTEKNPGTIHRFGKTIHDQIFRSQLTPNEVASYQAHLAKLKARGHEIYSTNYWNNLSDNTQNRMPMPTITNKSARQASHVMSVQLEQDLTCMVFLMLFTLFLTLVTQMMLNEEVARFDMTFANLTQQIQNYQAGYCYDQ